MVVSDLHIANILNLFINWAGIQDNGIKYYNHTGGKTYNILFLENRAVRGE